MSLHEAQNPTIAFRTLNMTTMPLVNADELLRVLVEDASDYAFMILDPEGCIKHWNHGAELLFGFPPEDIIDRHFSNLFTVEDVDSGVPDAELEQTRANGKAMDRRWHVRR